LSAAAATAGNPAKAGAPEGRVNPAKLGLVLFITAELMFFAGLISSFLVFRLSPIQWPPPGQPRLPVEVTSVNTAILLLSGVTFFLALKPLRQGRIPLFLKLLTATAVGGCLFLAIQGFEWVRLLHYGLTVRGSIFGGFFYCLVGVHALHVLGGLLALLWVVSQAYKGVYNPTHTLGVELCRTYWFLVVGLWPVLFGLVYF
jgi:cytochrome c oxidase subunit III